MARILAIDYGEKRTGLAVTDSMQLIATALTTIDSKQALPYLLDYCKSEPVEKIIIGLPTRLNNEMSAIESSIQHFIKNLQIKLPNIPILRYDERFTSSMAASAMIEAGAKKKQRRDKTMLDKISATLILQSYMESKREL